MKRPNQTKNASLNEYCLYISAWEKLFKNSLGHQMRIHPPIKIVPSKCTIYCCLSNTFKNYSIQLFEKLLSLLKKKRYICDIFFPVKGFSLSTVRVRGQRDVACCKALWDKLICDIGLCKYKWVVLNWIVTNVLCTDPPKVKNLNITLWGFKGFVRCGSYTVRP